MQFLLLRRRIDLNLGGTWHGIHGRIGPGETALNAARRAVIAQTGLKPQAAYTADFVNQFFDPESDTMILAPVFAFELREPGPIALDTEFDDYAWCDRDEATDRLIYSGQRWAVRHIDDILGSQSSEAELYRID
jgi:dihydroneopterin triphosphate diphosphatase